MRPRLRSFELAWTDAAFDTIYPERGATGRPRSHLPHGVLSMHPGRFLDGVIATVPFEQSLGLRVTLWMIALAPLFTIRRFGTIRSITPEQRTRVLERLLTSRIYVVRQLAMSFKALATLLYVQSAPVREAMTQRSSRPKHGLVGAAQLLKRPRVRELAGVGGEHERAAE